MGERVRAHRRASRFRGIVVGIGGHFRRGLLQRAQNRFGGVAREACHDGDHAVVVVMDGHAARRDLRGGGVPVDRDPFVGADRALELRCSGPETGAGSVSYSRTRCEGSQRPLLRRTSPPPGGRCP